VAATEALLDQVVASTGACCWCRNASCCSSSKPWTIAHSFHICAAGIPIYRAFSLLSFLTKLLRFGQTAHSNMAIFSAFCLLSRQQVLKIKSLNIVKCIHPWLYDMFYPHDTSPSFLITFTSNNMCQSSSGSTKYKRHSRLLVIANIEHVYLTAPGVGKAFFANPP
jgi:hypothetical protein